MLAIAGPFTTDPLPLFAGGAIGGRPGWLPGFGTIDPNMGNTAWALGVRAARDLLSGALPLWNHDEGLGTPLLGEMQSAALFPPTLLLLLPHGQMLEHGALQIVAGLGMFLFLRRFGLGVTAALAGGIIFELNGVFAWLRNAIFNPVAFLPWLFYAVESLYGAARARQRLAERVRPIGTAAIAAALALYAGFPEVVYFYCLPLLAWVSLRAVSLPLGRAAAFLGDLCAAAVLAFLLALPLLIAFLQFLPEAELGGHQADLFQNSVLPPASLLMILLPYVFGPISAAPQESVAAIWGSIGGYLGAMPALLAVGGLIAGWRRAEAWLLAAWVVIAIGASHGAPLLHAAFLQLPLAAIAAYCRYLDAGWIFCCASLSAIGIDMLPSLPQARRRLGVAAGAILLALLAGAVVAAWPVLAELWQARLGQRRPMLLSFAITALLLAGVGAAFRTRTAGSTQCVLTALLGIEAALAFVLPFLSYPRIEAVDNALIQFLQLHAGLQRVAIASGPGLSPNAGSAFGIATLNYNDLPIPRRTVAYVRERLDPAASAIIFAPNPGVLPQAARARQRAAIMGHLGGYEAAGVRYMLADADFFATPAYALSDAPAVPLPLSTGSKLATDGLAAEAVTASGVMLRIGTYGGRADGRLLVLLCQGESCARGQADLAQVADNRVTTIALDRPAALAAGRFRMTLAKQGGGNDVALWSRPTDLPAGAAVLPELALTSPSDPTPVLATPTTTIFALAHPRPYASAEGCRVTATTHNKIWAACDHTSRLLRLELSMLGWEARVNGAVSPILPIEDTFQGVDLPEGESTIEFRYAPPYVRPAVPVALVTLLTLVGGMALIPGRRRFSSRTQRRSGA